MAAPKSVVLLTVDCLRADHVGFLGYSRPTTPFLDQLAGESAVFETAIAAGSPTYYSFPAIMASRHPLALGRDVIGVAPEEPTLASTLSQMGYSTAAFVAANPYLSSRSGYDIGFDVFDDFVSAPLFAEAETGKAISHGWRGTWNRRISQACHRWGPLEKLYNELYFHYGQSKSALSNVSFDSLRRFPSADVLVDRAAQWLPGVGDSPFFLWLHFMDPHAPYYPKAEALATLDRADLKAERARYLNLSWNRSNLSESRLARYKSDIIALYDAGIRHVDDQIARLVQQLQKQNLWRECIVALTADHGEEFLEHGSRFHSPIKMTEELIRVPLLLRSPKLPACREQSPFSLIDLAPTLLKTAGIPVPARFQGISYSATAPAKAVITEAVVGCNNPFQSKARDGRRILSVRERRFKLVLDMKDGRDLLFDLQTDPSEQHPLAHNQRQQDRRRLLEVARAHLGDSVNQRSQADRLQALIREFQLDPHLHQAPSAT